MPQQTYSATRLTTPLADGIVLTISAEPLGDLRPGPLRLFLGLRKLAGHARRFTTYTTTNNQNNRPYESPDDYPYIKDTAIDVPDGMRGCPVAGTDGCVLSKT